MAQYKTGTVAVTNGSTTVTGTGTAWIANIAAGQLFVVQGVNLVYQIATVNNNASLTLVEPYEGATASAAAYLVVRDYTTNYSLPLLQPGDLMTGLLVNRALTAIDTDLAAQSVPHVPALVPEGGTGAQSFNAHGIMLGSGANALYSLSALSTGALLIGAGASADPTALAIGTSGKVLTSNGTTPTWSAIPAAGSAGQLQYNNAGTPGGLTIGGDASLNSSTGALTVASIGGKNVSLSAALTTAGAYGLTLTVGATTNVTLPPSGTLLANSNNLSDLSSAATARGNLGLGTMATQGAGAVAITGGSITGLSAAVNPSDVTILSQVQTLVATGSNTYQEATAYFASNVTISSPGALTDGSYTVASGNIVLLAGQTTTSQNGPQVYNGPSSAMTRPAWYASGLALTQKIVVTIDGTGSSKQNWMYILNTTPVTVDTTGTTWGTVQPQLSASGAITLSGGALTLNSNGVTNSYLAQMAASTLKGNPTAGAANAQDLTLGSTLAFSGTALQTAAGSGDVTWSANSFATTVCKIGGVGISLAGSLTHAGAYATTITATAATSVTLPVSGTLISSATALGGAVTGTPSSSTYLRGDGTWAAGTTTGTINSGTAGQLAYYAANGQTLSGLNLDISATVGSITVGAQGSVAGSLIATGSGSTSGILTLNGYTSGAVTLTVPGVAGSNTITMPAVTDTLAVLAAAQTFTNKTLTSPTINTAVAGGVWTAASAWTLPAVTLGGAVTATGQTITGGTHANITLSGTTTLADGGSLTASANQLVAPTAIHGTATNDSAAAGYVGEFVSANVGPGSAVGLTYSTLAAITSLSLTAGDWDVWGVINYTGTSTTVLQVATTQINTSVALTPLGSTERTDTGWNSAGGSGVFLNDDMSQLVGPTRISVATTTTVYLITRANFITSTCSAYGTLAARRAR